MSADWKAGDRALCVDGSPDAWGVGVTPPSVGTIYLVREVVAAHDPDMHEGVGLCIGLDGEDEGAWCANRFRKVIPACDRQAVAQEREAGV